MKQISQEKAIKTEVAPERVGKVEIGSLLEKVAMVRQSLIHLAF